ncbi:hypothetical protein [Acinetobacter sp. ANC 4973]|nr:hypothetical protein [Acinetobacter sp. ANC 4973]
MAQAVFLFAFDELNRIFKILVLQAAGIAPKMTNERRRLLLPIGI